MVFGPSGRPYHPITQGKIERWTERQPKVLYRGTDKTTFSSLDRR